MGKGVNLVLEAYQFDQWNNKFWHRSIPVYCFGFTAIIYIYIYIYNKYKSLPQNITLIQNKLSMVLDFSINKKKENTI